MLHTVGLILLTLALSADLTFEIPPTPVSVTIADQPVAIVLSGSVMSEGPALRLNLHADLGDFQQRLTAILHKELDKSDRCGERIALEDAQLLPAAPAGILTAHMHVEKWVCIKAFGKENAKRLLGGNGMVEMRLTPRIEGGSGVAMDAQVGRIEADGSLGEVLRSGALGDALKDRIREALLKSVRKAADMNSLLPEQAREYANIGSLAFTDRGSGRLGLDVEGTLQIPEDRLASVMEQFRHRK